MNCLQYIFLKKKRYLQKQKTEMRKRPSSNYLLKGILEIFPAAIISLVNNIYLKK